jgi:hypothetical protein
MLVLGSDDDDKSNSTPTYSQKQKSVSKSSTSTCSTCTHVEDYGHWIPQDPAGKKRESHRILQELVGNHRKKSENFPVGILLPRSSGFGCFPAGTGP